MIAYMPSNEKANKAFQRTPNTPRRLLRMPLAFFRKNTAAHSAQLNYALGRPAQGKLCQL